jgi:hypothetical protein
MPRVLVWTLLTAAIAISGCQSSPSAHMNRKPCNPRIDDAGYCYGIALPPLPGQ